MNDFAPLDDLLTGLADRLDGDARKRLGRTVAEDLRTTNAKRIKANVTPDGEAMVPRKAKPAGKLTDNADRKTSKSARAAAMFRRAATPRYLRKESSAGDAQVGFAGAMARIMRVHHYGLRDTVIRDPKAPEVTYPERPVIGLTTDDRLRILDRVLHGTHER
ncbi:MAG: phage virion morphogenesis protein [Pseudomonadota bacterium]